MTPDEYGVYIRDKIYPNESNATGLEGFGERGAILTFPSSPSRQYTPRAPLTPTEDGSTTILARVGVSLISVSQACENAESEIPDFDFEGLRESARKEWNELLGRFEVPAKDIEDEKDTAVLFYSSVSTSSILRHNITEHQ